MKRMSNKVFKYSLQISVAGAPINLSLSSIRLWNFYSNIYTVSEHITTPVATITIVDEVKNYMLVLDEKKIIVRFKKSKLNSTLLDSYTRLLALFACLLLRQKMIILHGSSFVKNNKSYVFIGPSGAGKSTVIHKAPSKNVLSDDAVIIKKVKNKYLAFTSPFEKFKNPQIIYQSAQLGSVSFIRQAVKVKVMKANNMNMFRYVFYNSILYIYWFSDRIHKDITISYKSDNLKKQIETVAHIVILDLIKNIRIQKIYLTKDFDIYNYSK